MDPRSSSRLSLGLLLFAAGTAPGQEHSHWRVYKEEDGLRVSFTTAVTASPKGMIWAKHGIDAISALDGYTITSIPVSGGGNFKVHQSRSDQIWSLYGEGLEEFKGGRWIRYPIADIRVENRSIPLLPAERDHVLFLLADRLMEFDAARNQTAVLRLARDTGLGRFSDLIPTHDGGALVTGTGGVARLPGPIRHLSAATEWREHLLPAGLGIAGLQRAAEDENGVLTLVAELSSTNRKAVVTFDGQNWRIEGTTPENLRQAWRTPDGTTWVLAQGSLFRLLHGEFEIQKKQGPLAGNVYDVAIEGNGVFWLATAEGLVRHAPNPWRAAGGGPAQEVYALAEDRASRLWALTADALWHETREGWEKFRLPDPLAEESPSAYRLAVLPDASLAFSANDRLLKFAPNTRRFERVPGPGRQRVLGQAADHRVIVARSAPGGEEGTLDWFDGVRWQRWMRLPEGWTNDLPQFTVLTAKGDTWVGGADGVALFQGNRWTHFGATNGFTWDQALGLVEIDDGRVWCATRNAIVEFDGRTWSFVRGGFDRIGSILKSRASVWVATRGGLHRHFEGAWLPNGIDEGLPSSAAQIVFESRNGDIWAGTAGGLSRYFPGADTDPPRTSVYTTERQLKATPAGLFHIHFGARDKWKYTPPERLLYSYQLDEGAWSRYQPAPLATFTNLAGGDHRFAVRSMDRNGNRELAPVAIGFSVVVPWFRDPRLVAITVLGTVLVISLASIAVNRHLRLMRSYAEVERIVAERSRQLERANEELLHSQKMKALGTMAAGISHDFNSILSIIKGSVQIIEANLDDKEKVRVRVDRVKTAVNQGAGLVKAMLGFSGAPEKRLTEFPLNRTVEEALKLLSDRLSPALTVRFEPGAIPKPVRGAREWIQQMVMNLVLNAADAMFESGIITVRTGHLTRLPPALVLPPAAAPEYGYLSVHDRGCGIESDVLPRIFEPFFTTKAFSTKRGTGLGLSMVYEFAKEMGYGLGVESTPGAGSTFTVIIPL